VCRSARDWHRNTAWMPRQKDKPKEQQTKRKLKTK